MEDAKVLGRWDGTMAFKSEVLLLSLQSESQGSAPAVCACVDER